VQESPIRVLVVDDSALVRRVIAQILQVQPDMQLVGEAPDGREGAHLAGELQPDIILMDVYMPDLDGIEATRLLAGRVPNGGVITVTADERPELREQAAAAGAMGLVLKPLGDGEELLEVVRTIFGQLQERRLARDEEDTGELITKREPGRCISVVGTKGGVGKTSIALGLAICLRQQNHSVCLVDADFLFGDLNVQLDLPGDRSIVDLVPHAAALDAYVVNQAVRQHSTGIDLLACPPRPEQADVVTADAVRAVIQILVGMYDFVIVDTPASYDERALAIFDETDVFVIILAPLLGALQNAHHFVDLGKMLGYPIDQMVFVLNRANSLAGLKLDLIADVVGRRRKLLQVPSGGDAVSESINRGMPMNMSQPQTAYARAVAAVAEEVRTLALAAPARAAQD
jgi:pilus assembly protein CpaE